MSSCEILTDEKLVIKASEGDAAAEELLIRRYMPLVRSKARLYFVMGGDSEDLVQEGMIGVFRAIHSYDRSRDIEFRTYMNACIDNQIYSAIERAGRLKHAPLNTSMSLDAGMDEPNPVLTEMADRLEERPEERLLFKDMMSDIFENAKSLFSPFEYKVWQELIKGKDYQEIAAALERSPKAVDNALQRIKKKIMKRLSC